MIVYFDSSAIVPLLVDEPSSSLCEEFYGLADRVVTARVSYVEVAAALAMAGRMHRLTSLAGALDGLAQFWSTTDVVELDQPLVEHAAVLARNHALRGYDAVQCAAGLLVNAPDVVAVSGDAQLLRAWHAEGLATGDSRTPPHDR